jgi:RND family efflux transporter MFP subunit
MAIRRRASRALLLLLLIAASGLVGCTSEVEPAPPAPRPALVAVVEAAVSDGSGFTGLVRARQRAALAVTVPGRVLRVHVDLGDRVERGQALLSLDTTAVEAAVLGAEAALAHASALALDSAQRLERAKAASASGAASPTEFGALTASAEAAAAQVTSARAALAEARWRHAQSQLRSPIDGVVAARHVEPGQALAEGMPAIEIDGYGRELVLDLPLSIALALGDAVRLTGPGGQAEGRVVQLNERLEAAATRRAVLAIPDAARVGELWTLHPEASAGEVYVPLRAVQRKAPAGATFVLRLSTETGEVSSVLVSVGPARGSMIAIREGLQVGEHVVIAGASALRDGDRVVAADSLR